MVDGVEVKVTAEPNTSRSTGRSRITTGTSAARASMAARPKRSAASRTPQSTRGGGAGQPAG